MTDWLPIESAPEAVEVLVITDSNRHYLATRFGPAWRWARGAFPKWHRPVFWQPLPAPPSEGE